MKPPVDAPTSSARTSAGVDVKDVERVCQLDSAASDVRMIRLHEINVGIRRDRSTCLRNDVTVDRDLAGKNHRASALASRSKAALDDQNVKSRLHQFFRVTTHSAMAGR